MFVIATNDFVGNDEVMYPLNHVLKTMNICNGGGSVVLAIKIPQLVQ